MKNDAAKNARNESQAIDNWAHKRLRWLFTAHSKEIMQLTSIQWKKLVGRRNGGDASAEWKKRITTTKSMTTKQQPLILLEFI